MPYLPLQLIVSLKRNLPLMYVSSRMGNSRCFELYRTHVNNNNNEDVPVSNNLKITIGSVSFNATLESNETTKEFKKLLPLTVKMSELNGNEKLFYLQNSLPTASFNPRTIQTGDLMLYGSTCVVLFYESFSTPYTYTRLGNV